MISKAEKAIAPSIKQPKILNPWARDILKDVADTLSRAATDLSALTGNPQRWASFEPGDRVQIYSISNRLLSIRVDLREALRNGMQLDDTKL